MKRSTHSKPRASSVRSAGFSIPELLVVMMIVAVLAAVAVPSFSKLVKTSSVDQACQAVMTSIFHARAEAMRARRVVALYIGDDLTALKTQPLAGVLPPRGEVRLYSVKTQPVDRISSGEMPFSMPSGAAQWYPFVDVDRELEPVGVSLPSNIRVLAYCFNRYKDASGNWHNELSLPNGTLDPAQAAANPQAVVMQFNSFYYKKGDSTGELIRHALVFGKNGGMPCWYDGLHCFWSVLVINTNSGDHAIISAGEYRCSARPLVLPYQLTDIQDTSGGWHHLSNPDDIRKLPSWLEL